MGGGGWGNNELQYYTSGANATVSGGVLTITARRVSGGFSCWYGPCQYTSARMITRGKREFTYGKIEARLALPMGQGLVARLLDPGHEHRIGGLAGLRRDRRHGARQPRDADPRDDPLGCRRDTRATAARGPCADPTAFHVYAIEWTPAAIKWFVDGVQYREANILNSINSTEEFHRPFFILLNLAVGGNWPGSPDGAHGRSRPRLQVDYVRVYQQGTGGGRDLAHRLVHGAEPEQHHVRGPGRRVDRQRHAGPAVALSAAVSTSSGSSAPPTTATTTSSLARPTNLTWDVTGGAGRHRQRGEGATVELRRQRRPNQQWRPESLGGGRWRFRARHSGRCLDVPGASTAAGVQLQQWDCNGTGAQSFLLTPRP